MYIVKIMKIKIWDRPLFYIFIVDAAMVFDIFRFISFHKSNLFNVMSNESNKCEHYSGDAYRKCELSFMYIYIKLTVEEDYHLRLT